MAQTQRRCSRCWNPKPSDDFRRRGAGRHTECRDCHNKLERERRQAKKRRTLASLVNQLADERDASAARALARTMCQKFGGVEGVSNFWHRQISVNGTDPKTAKLATNGLAALARLAEACA